MKTSTQLSEYRPFSPLFSEFPSLLQGFLGGMEGTATRTPRVDVKETAEEYEIEADLPGCKPEDLSVSVIGDTLTIQGECKQERREEGERWHVHERSYGNFRRTFRFPSAVEEQGVEAEYTDGVLKVCVKKSPEARERQIEIKRHDRDRSIDVQKGEQGEVARTGEEQRQERKRENK